MESKNEKLYFISFKFILSSFIRNLGDLHPILPWGGTTLRLGGVISPQATMFSHTPIYVFMCCIISSLKNHISPK